MTFAAPPASSETRATGTAWYRHRWPWLLMLGPVIVVVAGIVTTWLAVATDDGLVADDYYKRGLAINRQLARADRAASLGLSATVDIDAAGAVRAVVTSEQGLRPQPTVVRLQLVHPTRTGLDQRADLVRGPDGAYVGRIAPVTAGRWLVIVEHDEWRLPAVPVTSDARGIRLTTSGAN